MMAYDLGGNWATELLRMRLALKLPVARIDELIPPYPGDKPLPVIDYSALYRDLKVNAELGTKALLSAPESHVEGVGSNNWVVAGSRSVTGKPLLANDPHLKLTAPPLWYFARIRTPEGNVAGATMPGVPMVVLGQNDHVAWGWTNTAPDVQDLYLERIDPDDPNRYQTPDGWAAFERFDEVIKVKGQDDVKLTVRATRHGPVISDSGIGSDMTGPRRKPGYAIAMRWTALDADVRPDRGGCRVQPRAQRRRVHRRRRTLGRADAEHGGRRPRRRHRLRRAGARAAAPRRQRPEGARAGARLGRALRLGRLHRHGADAARAESIARLDRHGQPQDSRRRLSALHHQRMGIAVPAAAHRTAHRCDSET